MRTAACTLVICFAAATRAWALTPCPAAARDVTLTGTVVGWAYGGTPQPHYLQMHPCEEFWLDVQASSPDPNVHTNIYVDVFNTLGTKIDTKNWVISYLGSTSFSTPNALPTASLGFPQPGTRDPRSLVTRIEIWSDYARAGALAVSYTLTVHFRPRPGYNLGGLSYTDAYGPLAHGTVLKASMWPGEVNYYRVSLLPGGALTLSGSLTNENWGLGAHLLITLRNMAQQSQGTMLSQVVTNNSSHDPNGVTVNFTSTTFTNTSAQTQDFYIDMENANSARLQDITINVTGDLVPPPQLTLFLDADSNFSTTNPSSDHLSYVPGAALSSGVSVSLPQNLQLVAAYLNANGQIVPPPAWVSIITFGLTDTSAFIGQAMNLGNQTTPDFQLGASQVSVSGDNTARVTLICDDYGGFTTSTATDGVVAPGFRLPEDGANNNWLPSVGWYIPTAGSPAPDQGAAADDVDSAPTGNGDPGDGLSAFEEFRGFMVLGTHIRTHPANKDLFVHSQFVVEGLGDAWDLPVSLHQIGAEELDGFRRIAPNYTNSGAGGNIPGHFWGTLANSQQSEQLAVIVFKDVTTDSLPSSNTAVGTTNSQLVNGVATLGPPWTVGALGSTVYTLRIRKISPDDNNATDIDPHDQDKTHQTIAHEIGHNVALDDVNWGLQCPPYANTVMAVSYFTQTTNLNDCAWTHIPHGFQASDLVLLKVR